MALCSNDVEYFFNTIQDVSLGVTFKNTALNVNNLPTLTATPTYFEFTGLNVNDSAVSRLVQNSTGSPVYITGLTLFHNDSDSDFDYDKWVTSNTCEHKLDVCSSNNNYPTDTVRTFFEAERYDEVLTRYKHEISYSGRGPFALSTSYRSGWIQLKYDPPVFCEAGNYVRLYKNGNTTHLASQRIAVIGYY